MNDLQKCQLEILVKTVEVINKHGLRYCLIGGTLLGAIRHQGFIPWDDDIDIAMPREDFDKFAKIANQELDKELFYQDKTSNPNYPYNFAKVRKNDTKFIQKQLKDIDMHHGVFIDIFPLDYSSDKSTQQKLHVYKVALLNYISISDTLVKSDNNQSIAKQIEVFILKSMRRLGGKLIPKSLNANLRRYNNTSHMGILLGNMRLRELMPNNYFYDERGCWGTAIFEGIEFVAPIKPHEYLTNIYRNYMQMPPEEERISHHQTDTIEL